MNKKRDLIYSMCLTAVFAALTYILTIFISIPINLGGVGSGYFNFSDVLIFALAGLVGPFYAGFAGGLAGLLSDITLGYAAFAPYTLVIKFIEGVFAGYIFKALKKVGADNKVNNIWKSLTSFVIGGLIMACLYMIPDIVVYVTSVVGNTQGSDYLIIFVDLAFNALQGIINAGIGCVVFMALYQVKDLFIRRGSYKKASANQTNVIESKDDKERK